MNHLEKLVNTRLDKFLKDYEESSILFQDNSKKNGLIHPGEYGVYKERLITDLFQHMLPKKYAFCSGFVTNHNGKITSQCDLIIYDSNNAPFLEEEKNLKFVPQEIVYAIVEVKSKLSKKELSRALIKLAEKKTIREEMLVLSNDYENVKINPCIHHTHSIMTMLICDEVTAWDDTIYSYIVSEYQKQGIPISGWHNIILSLKNGILVYDIHDVAKLIINLKPGIRSVYGKLEYAQFASPIFAVEQIPLPLKPVIVAKRDKTENLKLFLMLVNNFIIHLKSYYPEPRLYLNGTS